MVKVVMNNDETLVMMVSFLVGMIAIVKPIVGLNGNITKLTTILENFRNDYEKSHKTLENRVNSAKQYRTIFYWRLKERYRHEFPGCSRGVYTYM